MNVDEALRTALLDLLNAVPDLASKLLVGGGFGLFIRQQSLAARALESGVETTLVPASTWSQLRSTQDIDLFMVPELIVSGPDFDRLAAALEMIGFKPHKLAWSWTRTVGTQVVQVEFLSPGEGEFDAAQVKRERGDYRVQPRRRATHRKMLHARGTPEAIALEESPCQVRVSGRLSDGQRVERDVLVPHPFCYLILKLHAFRDRQNPKRPENKDDDQARKHAFDLFRIVAMMTRVELGQCNDLSKSKGNPHREPVVQESRRIRRAFFADDLALGCTRIREHELFDSDRDHDLAQFREVLAEVFGD